MLAPVLITVYNRYDHIRECINCLLKCSLASQTDVYISSDAPSKSEDSEAISQIRNYLRTVSGFNRVTIIERQQNIGSYQNFMLSVNDIFKIYDRVILLEDDCLVVPQFLEYMNKSLLYFKDNRSIFSISGYNYPIDFRGDSRRKTYLWQGFSAWGVGMWKHKWSEINWGNAFIDSYILNIRKVNKTMKIANHILPVLYYDKRRGRMVSDAVITINLIDKGLYTIFPVISLIKNIGSDGSGESGVRSDRFLDQQTDQSDLINIEKDTQVCPNINKALFDYFSMKPFSKIKFYARLFILNKLFGYE